MKRIAVLAICFSLVASAAYAAFAIFQVNGSGAIATYIGLVGTRAKILASYDTSNNQMMSKTFTYARTNIISVQARFGCWYEDTNTNVESAPGSNCVITGSAEYPPGTCVPFTFSSASSATVAAGSDVLSDPVTIAIPNGAKYFINEYLTNASGILLADEQGDTTNGDSINVGVSGITDRTVTCTSVPNSGGFQSFPLAIVGAVPTSQASVCIFGDSIGDGIHDTYSGTSGDLGIIARSIGPSLGYINLAISGDASSRFNSGHTQRIKLVPYCTSAISEYGHNNFAGDGEGLSTMEASLMTMYTTLAASLIGSKTIIQTTLIPWTTSTPGVGAGDNWATLGGQTVAGFNASLVGYNAALRAATTGPTGGYYDTDSILGTSTDLMFWITNGSAFAFTVDGVHPSPAGYALIQSSGIIDTTRLH
jgi:hypothetical protein